MGSPRASARREGVPGLEHGTAQDRCARSDPQAHPRALPRLAGPILFSCPLDSSHLWAALRYTELNPVRAGLVTAPQEWNWSSAAAHCGAATSDALLEMEPWRNRWNVSEWREYLAAGESEADLATLRQCTHTGRPLGSLEFIEALENPRTATSLRKREVVPRSPSPMAGSTRFPFGSCRKIRERPVCPRVPPCAPAPNIAPTRTD
jgi:hypothetical protein